MRDLLAVSMMIRAWNGSLKKLFFTVMAMAALASVRSQQTFAQSAATVPLLTLRGSTFDSLTGRPLAAATVRIAGRIDTQVSDAQGLFKFDSIPAGAYLLIMEHPRLDSLGLPEVATRISISRDRQDATVAVPSFATLWRGVCGARKAPTDSGLVYGAIRDAASRRGLERARVFISWYDVGLKKQKLQQTRLTLETSSDSTGSYVACGVPTGVPLEISALQSVAGAIANDTALVAAFTLPARTTRIQRRDLVVATNAAGRAVMKGSVRGRITNESSEPFADVQVLMDGREVARTDGSGNYALTDIAIGTHTIQFASLGRALVSRIVDLAPGSTMIVGARLDKVAVTPVQDEMRDDVADMTMRAFRQRKLKYSLSVIDSSRLAKRKSMEDVLRAIDSKVEVRTTKGRILFPAFTDRMGNVSPSCEPNFYIDNNLQTYEQFWRLSVTDIAWIEYSRTIASTPLEFRGPLDCGSMALFTKQFIRR